MKFLSTTLICTLLFLKSFSQESQHEIMATYESGIYTVYKVNDKNKFEKIEKGWPIEIKKTDKTINSVLVKRAGILDELFSPDVIGYPSHFFYKDTRLTFLKSYAVYYSWDSKLQATAKYVFVKEGEKLTEDFPTVNQAIQNYVIATFKNQSTAKVEQKEERGKLAEAERKANSLEGKDPVSLEIQLIDPPTQIAHFGKAIHYGIVATLKSGEKLKTPNLGGKLPWDDFILSHEGCSNIAEIADVENDAEKIPNDVITFNVTSVYHKQLKASKSIATTNDVGIQNSRNGFRGIDRGQHMIVFQGVDGQDAGNGETLTIKVTASKNKKTGAAINKIEVFSVTENKVVGRYKLSPETELIINAKGGIGMDGRKGYSSSTVGGKGGKGGNGGSVTIIKDPSVTELNIKVNNQGGKGGKGGPPDSPSGVKGSDGNDGSDGSTSTQIGKVTLNF